MHLSKHVKLLGVLALSSLALAACSGGDPLASTSEGASTSTGDSANNSPIVVGSQDYYSNEIIAEIYAQALSAKGLDVKREFRIGQREAYIGEIESGKIDLFPEYSGPLLRYWDKESTATTADDVLTALKATTPQGLQVLSMAPAADQDSYTVSKAFADKWGLKNLSDITKVTDPITVAANSELESRPFGPKGLKEATDVEVKFTPIEDGGGPLTVKALKDGTVQMAIVYTASPSLAENDLVSLNDDKGLFTASNIVAIGSTDLPEEAVTTINEINSKLETDQLIQMNMKSVNDQLPADKIAEEWLSTNYTN
ncbi:ABC transporter substrate-binding protein [Stomatohabitans albus]|uniref:ABC transporter substrate-binding protein n=1 Tax=Stomatohabitans albus TaxID=3110766 RepID=UPI00300C7B41